MGIFNFLKKDKADTTAAGMDLPPVPNLEGPGGADAFPEMKSEEVPEAFYGGGEEEKHGLWRATAGVEGD